MMFFPDSDTDFDFDPEDYHGHEYFDYMFDDMYDDLDDSDFGYTEDDEDDNENYDEASYKSSPSEEELNHMKRCTEWYKKLNENRKEGLFCDASIVIESQKFPVHKNILTAASSYFCTMFTGSFTEKDEKDIEIQGVTPDVFQVLLDYIYGVKISLSFENIKDIYIAADMLCVDALIEDCKQYIKRNWMTSNDVPGVYEMAKQFDMVDTANDILHRARSHLLSSMGGTDYRELPVSFLQIILEGRNELVYLKNESVMAEYLLRWIFFRPEERLKEVALELFAHIHFEFVLQAPFTTMLEFIRIQEVAVAQLNEFREVFECFYSSSHKKISDQCVRLVSPGSSEAPKVAVFDPVMWKWDYHTCNLPPAPRSYLLNDNDFYVFNNGGGNKYSLQTHQMSSLPVLPEKRSQSVYAIVDKTLYMTGGVKDNSDQVLGEIMELKPGTKSWKHKITWRRPKCDASCLSVKQSIFFIGGHNPHDKPLPFAECFVYNSITTYFKKIGRLAYPLAHPKLAAYKDVLYIFSSTDSLRLGRIDITKQKIIPSENIKLTYNFPILDVCVVSDGILIAYWYEDSILLGMFRPHEQMATQLLGFVPKPIHSDHLPSFFSFRPCVFLQKYQTKEE